MTSFKQLDSIMEKDILNEKIEMLKFEIYNVISTQKFIIGTSFDVFE